MRKLLSLQGVVAICWLVALSSVPAKSGTLATPAISYATQIQTKQNQTIVIAGAGFGVHAAYTGISHFLSFVDLTRPFSAGATGDSVGVNVTSWTDTQIVVAGFTGNYGGINAFQTGDAMMIVVSNAQATGTWISDSVCLGIVGSIFPCTGPR